MTKKLFLLFLLLAPALEGQNLSTSVQRYFTSIRRNLEASADAMPADKFSFKLTPGQMSFAEWINHGTQRNYADCAILKGESAPAAAQQSTTLKEKAEVTQALKDSFAYCADAMKNIDDQKAISTPEIANAYLHTIVHNNEIYGNIVGYMRSSGVVPPSTAARKGKKN
jgi:hypothetical protein